MTPYSQTQHILLTILKSIVLLGTFPYYRFFQFNTLGPVLRIAAYNSQPAQAHKVLQLLVRWRTRKLAELQFISIAVSPPFSRISSKSLSKCSKLTNTKLSVLYSPLPSLVLSLGLRLLMRIGLLPRSGIVASYFRSLDYCSQRSRLQCCICWKQMKHMANLVLKKWMLTVTFR